MDQDISNKTIVVLVILTVIISILGTVVVLNEISNARIVALQRPTASTSQGKVSLTILPAPPEPVAIECNNRC
nr:hypothetical protein [Nanoarchaeota archaeon]